MTGSSDLHAVTARLASVPPADAALAVWQDHIGRWALAEFGPSPADVTATALLGECQDVIERAVIGDTEALGPALAGVLVVALALSHRLGLDLAAALQEEQARNQLSSWSANPYGQMRRVTDDVSATLHGSLAQRLIREAAQGTEPPQRVLSWLVTMGLPFRLASAALTEAGVAPGALASPSPLDDPTLKA